MNFPAIVVATVRALASPDAERCRCGGPSTSPHSVAFEVTSTRGKRRVCTRELVQACEELTTDGKK